MFQQECRSLSKSTTQFEDANLDNTVEIVVEIFASGYQVPVWVAWVIFEKARATVKVQNKNGFIPQQCLGELSLSHPSPNY